jgi:hypothetical protein
LIGSEAGAFGMVGSGGRGALGCVGSTAVNRRIYIMHAHIDRKKREERNK